MAEVRIAREGALWWVRLSGSGNAFATAAGPASGVLGYVQSFTYTSAATIVPISDRGIPVHNKETEKMPIDVSFQFLSTGRFPTGVSGSGASVPMIALEHRVSAPEIGNGTTGDFHLFYGVPLNSFQFTENKDGNTIQVATKALGMIGPTGSGYLS